MDRPAIQYAINAAGLHVAYWTYGEGPRDVLWVPNFVGNTDAYWMHEPMARFLRRLSTVGRLTTLDVSGTGGSDPLDADRIPTMDLWMDDVRVVMDAAGIERATLFAIDAGAAFATLFAATHPDRVSRLVLFGAYARLMAAPDYPIGHPLELREKGIERWMQMWGTGAQLKLTGADVADDPGWREWFGFLERSSGPPRMRRRIFEMTSDLDIREILPSVRVPVLVMSRADSPWIGPAFGRYVAERIPEARYVEVPGAMHYPFLGDSESVIREVRSFVTGVEEEPFHDERVLATVLFTDIVDSTKLASELGDMRWRGLLDQHDDVVRDALARFRGRAVKTTGDGVLAMFDGPARAVRCAAAIRDAVRSLGLTIRAGLHCGEVEVRGEDIGGLSVHVGSRVASLAAAGEVLVSQTVKDLTIGSQFGYHDRGSHELRGVPGEWRLYSVSTL